MSITTVIMLAVLVTANAVPLPNSTSTTTPTAENSTSNSSFQRGRDPGQIQCRLRSANPTIHNEVHHLLTVERATLINYMLNFSHYSENPLTINMAGVYNAKKWSRVTTAHGQTLLSLAFNYGVLSMYTLTLGTDTRNIELQDVPFGCFANLTDQQKVKPNKLYNEHNFYCFSAKKQGNSVNED